MCIFLMVATNEMCKFKVKFTLFSLPCDIKWWYSLNKKFLIFFLIDFFFFRFDLTHKKAFGVPSVHEKEGTHSLATTFNCIWKKINKCTFWKVLLFLNCFYDHGTPENSWFTADWRSSTTRVLLSHVHEYVKNMCVRYLLFIYAV